MSMNDVEGAICDNPLERPGGMGYLMIRFRRPYRRTKTRQHLTGNFGVASGKQHNLMAKLSQFLAERRDHQFGAAIAKWWNCDKRCRDHGNSHAGPLSTVSVIF